MHTRDHDHEQGRVRGRSQWMRKLASKQTRNRDSRSTNCCSRFWPHYLPATVDCTCSLSLSLSHSSFQNKAVIVFDWLIHNE